MGFDIDNFSDMAEQPSSVSYRSARPILLRQAENEGRLTSCFGGTFKSFADCCPGKVGHPLFANPVAWQWHGRADQPLTTWPKEACFLETV